MITIGTDPEVFLIDANDRLVSVVGRLGGTKEIPKPIGKGCAVQEDNVMAEFNTPPCTTVDHMWESINRCRSYIEGTTGLKTLVKASAIFDEEQLKHKQAQIFGCDPHWNVYTEEQESPDCVGSLMRSCGGHVSIGYPEPKNMHEKLSIFIRNLDLFLGVPSVLIDGDVRRRETYGKAGVFRIKPFGIEYRTLSNFWIDKRQHVEYIFDGVLKAYDWTMKGKSLNPQEQQIVRDTINHSDIEAAEHFVREYNLYNQQPKIALTA